MPRKAFNADVKAASEQVIAGITDVGRGDDDGDVNACYTPGTGSPIELGLLVTPDVGSYPTESTFMIFTRSVDVPKGVEGILQGIADSSAGMTVPELLGNISQKLHRYLATGSQNDPLSIDSDVDMPDGEEGQESEAESEDSYFPGSDDEFNIGGGHGGASVSATYSLNPQHAAKLNRRIKEDLRAVRFAGFKIGILIGMKADSVNSLLSLSIQAKKLGLSEEAMQAWDLEPQQYIVLLIRYSSGYKDFDAIINEPAKYHDVAFRIGVSNKYKPTIVEALAAFTDVSKNSGQSAGEDIEDAILEDKPTAGFSSMFISSSLNDFTNSQFISLLKIRNSVGIGWDGAKRYYNDKQGRLDIQTAELPSEYYEESNPLQSSLPDLVTADHLGDHQVKQISFPLIAAQFSLRYLTRCTEFCLVCHDKIKEDFEALKPYVCDKPLCLYQYMSLGFGPSVEHEILTQPYVVDLLVSFCYASAFNKRLREYPVGMSLAVPPASTATTYTPSDTHLSYHHILAPTPGLVLTTNLSAVNALPGLHDVKYDMNRQELIFEENSTSPIRNGDWVVIMTAGQQSDHFRVEDVSLYPTVKLSNVPVTRNTSVSQFGATSRPIAPVTPSMTPPPPNIVAAKMAVYNQNFDDMDDVAKGETIVMLLETLPSIKDMKAHLLQQSRTSEPSLRSWKERISPAALGMLRWIIASNRSCIVQVDKCPGQDEAELLMSRVRLDQRVSNISESWVQFRFAQGSPDKEQRFLNALRAQQANFDAKYPTMFAFHGSPLQNWHSIIRTGLDFKETLHGRAYGHGVYHAQDQNVSVGYAQHNTSIWQGSDLKITSAMSLNEIVNCPAQFASSHPYLVVQHIDWIQCRYLLVQVQGSGETFNPRGNSTNISANPDSSVEVEQDPSRTARSTLNKAIGVPFCAASISRAFRVNSTSETPSKKKRKQSSGSTFQFIEDSGSLSDSEDPEDLVFLFSDDESPPNKGKDKSDDTLVILSSMPKVPAKPLTDFVPGSLDQSTLPMLDPPSYATPMATKTLNRSLQEILEIQKKTPQHELGWYIDAELINNVYQWIVELHSFDPELPLAKDMKSARVSSVVLEIRFGKDYPFSPPFVRVIRPRFLPFTMGGGGHVTAGGAMCMELLTNSGWSSVSSIEGILLQVRLAMSNVEPRPARLEGQGKKQYNQDYSTGEAMAAFIRACAMHGWQVPKDFQEFAGVSDPSGY